MIENKFSDWHEELINYLVNPYDNRTLEAFAESVGTSLATLWRYRKQHQATLNRQVAEAKDLTFGAMRPAANKALARNLQSGDNQTLKLFYQLVGDLVERTEQTVKYTPEEKRQRIEELTKRFGISTHSNANGPALNDLQSNKGTVAKESND